MVCVSYCLCQSSWCNKSWSDCGDWKTLCVPCRKPFTIRATLRLTSDCRNCEIKRLIPFSLGAVFSSSKCTHNWDHVTGVGRRNFHRMSFEPGHALANFHQFQLASLRFKLLLEGTHRKKNLSLVHLKRKMFLDVKWNCVKQRKAAMLYNCNANL